MARVLLLGPDKERAAGIRSLLGHDGHHVIWARSTDDWRATERDVLPELIVVAVGSADRVLAAASQPGPGFLARGDPSDVKESVSNSNPEPLPWIAGGRPEW